MWHKNDLAERTTSFFHYGRSDILARNYYTGELLLFRHSGRLDGLETYTEPLVVSTAFGPESVDWLSVGAFTDSGATDIVAVTPNGRCVLYPVAMGPDRPVEHRAGFKLDCDLTRTVYHSVILADVDADGRVDIVARRAGSGCVDVILNESMAGRYAVAPPKPLATLRTTDYLVGMADVTGTGRPDLVVSRLKGVTAVYEFNPGRVKGTCSVLECAGEGNWYPVVEVAGGIRVVAVTDVNGDGWPDILGVRSDGALLAYLHSGVFWPQDPMATYHNPVVIGAGWEEFDTIN